MARPVPHTNEAFDAMNDAQFNDFWDGWFADMAQTVTDEDEWESEGEVARPFFDHRWPEDAVAWGVPPRHFFPVAA